mmetsp:Transcript_48030/g.88445  ORF Transcript_48030/g.88445 Transcript_48030/m.88445 type:complete len:218 (+) Transcript_48030:73-726(+)
MCQQANCTLLSHITLASVTMAMTAVAFFGVWFQRDHPTWIWTGQGCVEETSLHLYYRTVESTCWDGSAVAVSWADHCQATNDEGSICSAWQPSVGLHILTLILLTAAVSTAGAQACGCCCPGAKTNLFCSLGLTVAGFSFLSVAFAWFSTMKNNPMGSDGEYDFGWAWFVSLMSVLMLLAASVLLAIATFVQPVPMRNGTGAPPGAAPVVVGKPVEA